MAGRKSALEDLVKILLTGSHGFIGSHLYKKLKDKGHDVIPYDLKIDRDILNIEKLRRYIISFKPDMIIHLAASSQVTECQKEPYLAFNNNVTGTVNVLECARLLNVSRVIVASSDKCYGEKSEAYTETMSLDPINIYDTSKACTDLIARSYRKSFSMDIVTSRFCNVIGFDQNFLRLVPSTIKNCIFGIQPELRSSGLYKREWISIEDCVDGYIKLLDAPADEYNFGGYYLDVLTVTKMITSRFGSIEPKILNNTTGEIFDQKLNYDKTKKLLGWEPRVKLEDEIIKSIEQYKEYFKDNK